ncbi:MAG: DUF6356 family protein [Sphingomonadaceae bacterium]|nr:DUF6356 family protein [Sphingomonadaceae bacterium]
MAEPTLRRLFTEHPRSVGESYFEHMATAASFGRHMLVGALACFVHAVAPFLCVKTASRVVIGLHDRMVRNRARRGVDPLEHGHSFKDYGLGI